MAKSFEKAFEAMEQKKDNAPAAAVPDGYVLKRESKTRRTSLVLRPSTFEKLEDLAADQGKSRNDLINEIIEQYINDNTK